MISSLHLSLHSHLRYCYVLCFKAQLTLSCLSLRFWPSLISGRQRVVREYIYFLSQANSLSMVTVYSNIALHPQPRPHQAVVPPLNSEQCETSELAVTQIPPAFDSTKPLAKKSQRCYVTMSALHHTLFILVCSDSAESRFFIKWTQLFTHLWPLSCCWNKRTDVVGAMLPPSYARSFP